ncbi:MAG: glycosyltransferase, partial [Propionibacteriaceae bacterium]|nr:glycosyltransferase [Propionibacteriaceae bacterium]
MRCSPRQRLGWSRLPPAEPSGCERDVVPLISVIVPVRNAERHLSECLDSILRQTHRDLEIILVDDGSTDGSAAILATYAGQDSRIT